QVPDTVQHALGPGEAFEAPVEASRRRVDARVEGDRDVELHGRGPQWIVVGMAMRHAAPGEREEEAAACAGADRATKLARRLVRVAERQGRDRDGPPAAAGAAAPDSPG